MNMSLLWAVEALRLFVTLGHAIAMVVIVVFGPEVWTAVQWSVFVLRGVITVLFDSAGGE